MKHEIIDYRQAGSYLLNIFVGNLFLEVLGRVLRVDHVSEVLD